MTQQSQQADLLQQQIQELIKVGVGGKHRDAEDYTQKLKAELELEHIHMRGEGIKRYRRQVNNALTKSQESTTMYGLKYQSKYITRLADMINADVVTMLKGDAGRHRISLTLLCQCLNKLAFNKQEYLSNPENWDAVSLIILKNIINGISRGHTLNKLSIQIGTALELEARLTMFEDRDKETFNKVSKILNKNVILPQKQSKYLYKKNVFVYWMNRNNLRWNKWSKEQKLHLGTECIGYVEKLGIIKVVLVKRGKHKTVYYVNTTPKLINEIKEFNEMSEAMTPQFLPMIMPPMDWDYNPFRGGYYGRKYNQENTVEEVKDALQSNKKQ